MITEVNVKLMKDPVSRVLATVELMLEDGIVIHDLKVIEGRNGLFVAMPSRLGNDGVFRDVVHPTTRAARKKLDDLVLHEYRRMNRERRSQAVHPAG